MATALSWTWHMVVSSLPWCKSWTRIATKNGRIGTKPGWCYIWNTKTRWLWMRHLAKTDHVNPKPYKWKVVNGVLKERGKVYTLKSVEKKCLFYSKQIKSVCSKSTLCAFKIAFQLIFVKSTLNTFNIGKQRHTTFHSSPMNTWLISIRASFVCDYSIYTLPTPVLCFGGATWSATSLVVTKKWQVFSLCNVSPKWRVTPWLL